MPLESIGTPLLWVSFGVSVVFLLILDLGLLYRHTQAPSIKESLIWTGVWISTAFIFNIIVWLCFGADPALEFFAGYLIEKSLSVDNIFIFLLIFSYFNVPMRLQHNVLLWGIIGALLMRALFIWLGAVLIQEFHWIIYPFGALLLYTSIKLLIKAPSQPDVKNSWIVKFSKKFFRITPDFVRSAFFVKYHGKIYATPLFIVLLAIESTDLVFALDSIPAVFAVTRDPFIVYTSNIFAMLGLRALYFALAGVLAHLYYLRFGLALVLAFVGLKMLLSGFIHIPIMVSLLVIIVILATAIIASWFGPKPR
jgi:tellurite resistance protein TerC